MGIRNFIKLHFYVYDSIGSTTKKKSCILIDIDRITTIQEAEKGSIIFMENYSEGIPVIETIEEIGGILSYNY